MSRRQRSGADAGVVRRPSRLGRWLSTLLAMLAVPPLYTRVGIAVVLGVAGAAVIGLGFHWTARDGLDYGLTLQVVAVAVAGWEGVASPLLLTSTVLAVIAWEVGRYGFVVGEQLGRDARTVRMELTHVGYVSGVGVGGAALSYSLFRVSSGTDSISILALLAVGTFALIAALR